MGKRSYTTKSYHTFLCKECQKNALKVPARGYYNVMKEWICPDCIKKQLKVLYPDMGVE